MKFKIAMLALAGIAFMQPDANAQSSKFDKNYPICKSHNGYEVCDHDMIKTKTAATYVETYEVPVAKTQATEVKVPACEVTEVVYVSTSNKENPRFRVSYNVPGDVYEGEESLSNDGVKDNKTRNVNYLDWSVNRPPNDGGIAVK